MKKTSIISYFAASLAGAVVGCYSIVTEALALPQTAALYTDGTAAAVIWVVLLCAAFVGFCFIPFFLLSID